MHLSQIRLEQFRCYKLLELEIPPSGVRIAGSNASGKTSFIEAIQLLATMRSARAGVERELINWTSNQEYGLPPFARVSGTVISDGVPVGIDISLSVDRQRQSHTRKQIRIDDQPKRAIDAVGTLKTVLFEPEDMDLVLGSPSVRRRYLDVALSTLDATYLRLLSQYVKILEQRNSLLKSFRDQGRAERRNRMAELEYWDHELINRAAYIVTARIRFLATLTEPLQRAFRSLLGSEHVLGAEYAPAGDPEEGLIEQVRSQVPVEGQRAVAKWIEEEINQRRSEEIARGVTALGPHRDDLTLLLDRREIGAFGSRGQQRMAVVSIKLAEVETIAAITGESPVLLLDDVLSELDTIRQARLLERLSELGDQVIITATDASLLDVAQLQEMPMYRAESGELRVDHATR